MSKIKVYEDDTFVLYLQPVNDVVHLHVEVFEWVPSVLKKMYNIFALLKEDMKKAGFKYLVTITPNPKFAKLFGGEVISEQEVNGVHNEVIVWELIQ